MSGDRHGFDQSIAVLITIVVGLTAGILILVYILSTQGSVGDLAASIFGSSTEEIGGLAP